MSSPHNTGILKKPWVPLIISLLMIVLICGFSMIYLDRWIALQMTQWHLAHSMKLHPHDRSWVILTHLCYGLFSISLLGYSIAHLKGHRGRGMDCLKHLFLSVLVTFFIKSNLQFLLGRYVPRYAGSPTLLFTRDPHLYGFHFLHAGSFPSGHISVFVAACLPLCAYTSRGCWPLFCLSGGALSLGLIFLNFHFLSDVLAGIYLGAAVSYMTGSLLEKTNSTAE